MAMTSLCDLLPLESRLEFKWPFTKRLRHNLGIRVSIYHVYR